MLNFVYQNPTKILFGKGVIEHTGHETSEYGSRVLLVSGVNSCKNSGLYRQILDSLQANGCTVQSFDGVVPNPTVEHVRCGIEMAKRDNIEVICAVGGGSVIDSAKAIGAGCCVVHDVWKFFTGKKSVKDTLPLIAVPTLAASGSEMNSGMVLTNEQKQQKFGFANKRLFPRVALMDPRLTYTVSAPQTVYGAIDTLSHLMEVYFTNRQPAAVVPLQFIKGLARTVFDNLEIALTQPDNYDARANLMWASGLALNGLMVSGLGKVEFPMHLIEHSLSAMFDIPHGAGLAIIIPAWLQYRVRELSGPIQDFFGETAPGLLYSPDGAGQTIENLRNWFSSMGAPVQLGEYGIRREDIGEIAENSGPLSMVWRMKHYDGHLVREILDLCI